MSLTPEALTTVATLRQWLTQDTVADTGGRFAEAPLEGLINRASSAIATWCDRRLVAPAELTSYRLDGSGGNLLVLPQWPVAELTTVRVDAQEVPPRDVGGGAGWVCDSFVGRLTLYGATFARGAQNVEVLARLGYCPSCAATQLHHSAALADLEQACLLLAACWFRRPVAELVGAERAAPPEPLPAEVRSLLLPFRRLGG
ncbi:MAG: hypothetical protein IT204_21145 [Fimbriimonadaceae bacterium]|nr:hypothetical protein [Fimbriimonadaceae bacterium]